MPNIVKSFVDEHSILFGYNTNHEEIYFVDLRPVYSDRRTLRGIVQPHVWRGTQKRPFIACRPGNRQRVFDKTDKSV